MKSNDLGYYQNKYKIIVKFNDTDPKIQLQVGLLSIAIIVIGVSILYAFVLKKINGVQDIRDFLFTLILSVLFMVVIHEPIHAIFLRVFSEQKSKISPFYTMLRPNASVSRKEGIVSYLAPFLIITILLIVISFLVKPINRLAFVAPAIANVALCCQDLLFSFWLFRCKGTDIRLAHEKPKKGIDTIFFQG